MENVYFWNAIQIASSSFRIDPMAKHYYLSLLGHRKIIGVEYFVVYIGKYIVGTETVKGRREINTNFTTLSISFYVNYSATRNRDRIKNIRAATW